MERISPPELPAVDPDLRSVLIGGGAAYSNAKDLTEEGNLLNVGLEMATPEHPSVLIVPSARWKSEGGVAPTLSRLTGYYRSKGLEANILHPFLYSPHNLTRPQIEDLPIDPQRLPVQAELEDKVAAADVVFVLGGDTNRMLNQVWRPLGIDRLLNQAIKRGAIMTGTSAGSLAWFAGMHTDSSSLQPKNPSSSEHYSYLAGLNYITNTVAGAHYNTASTNDPNRLRQKSFHDMLYRRRQLGELGLGIDEDAALVTINGLASVVRGKGVGRRIIRAMHYRAGAKRSHDLTPADGKFLLSDLAS